MPVTMWDHVAVIDAIRSNDAVLVSDRKSGRMLDRVYEACGGRWRVRYEVGKLIDARVERLA